LPLTQIKNIKIKVCDGIINVLNFTIKTSFNSSLAKEQSDMFRQRNIENVIKINEYIKRNKYSWIADTTTFSKLTYTEKKKYFGKEELPNLYGFDYYAGGYFSFPQAYNSNENNKSDNIISDFDWRNRHGANNPSSPYYDGDNIDFSGWNTTRAEYQIAPNCWAFAPVYSMEALINLYYNQHLNINLSEQDVISCSGGQGYPPAPTPQNPDPDPCVGGITSIAVQYLKNTGVVNESCFPYSGLCTDQMPACTVKCSNPQYVFKASGSFSSYSPTEDNTKEKIITNGPIVGTVNQWGHAMSLEGYGKVREDDIIMSGNVPFSDAPEVLVVQGSPDIGKTYWIFKNSWGSWGSDHTPYMKLIMNLSNLYLFWNTVPLTCSGSQALTEEDRKWLDQDGDGYYWWGIGIKPADCPGDPNQEDCDDSDPILGPYDENYYCSLICDNFIYSSIPLEITSDEYWNDYRYINRDVVIKTGNTLTIREKIGFIEQSKIIVEPGAKLIVDNGTLTGTCGTMWQGIEVQGNKNASQYTPEAQGKVILENGAIIENAVDAIRTIKSLGDIDGDGNEDYDWAYTGGIIQANNATFRNNKNGIWFGSYHNFHPSTGTPKNNISHIKNCTFETTEDYIDITNPPYEFIGLYDVDGISIYGNTFRNTNTNYTGNGIMSYDASYNVKGLCLNPYIDPCPEYQPNTFQGLYYAIYADNSNNFIPVTINGNEFIDNFRSITLKNINNATVTENDLKFNNFFA